MYIGIKSNKIIQASAIIRVMGYVWAIYYLLFTYLLTTSVSGRVPGYPSYHPTGTRVINYPDTAALFTRLQLILTKCPITVSLSLVQTCTIEH